MYSVDDQGRKISGLFSASSILWLTTSPLLVLRNLHECYLGLIVHLVPEGIQTKLKLLNC